MRILHMPDAPAGAAAVAEPKAAPAATPPADKGSATTQNTSGHDGSMWDELDSQSTVKPKEKAAADPKDKKPDAEPDKDKSKQAEPKVDDPNKDAKTVIESGPRALRKRLEEVEKQRDELKRQFEEVGTKLKTFESKSPEQGKLAEQIAAITKERDEAKEQLRIAKREHSPDFLEKYDKPFNLAAGRAEAFVKRLTVTGEDGTTRPGTFDDIRALRQMPPNKAYEVAEQYFGKAAGAVMQHVFELDRLISDREFGLKEEKDYWEKHDRESAAKANAEKEFTKQVWSKINDDLIEKHEEWREIPDDKEYNELRTKSYSLVDQAFDEEKRASLTPQQAIVLDANIRHRAANFPAMKLRYERTAAELKEARARIEELENTGPGKTKKPGGGDAGKTPESMWDDLDKSMAGAT